ncbi:polysaccharide pyruvyl transferase family protein [Micrococcus luteus]|uniref:polysaccharide pyruvyl transferase family protein n=1 Tax=Micrococcus luteus TaxID=1270 RepID=UPI00301A586B
MKILVYGALPSQANLGVEALAHGAEAVLLRAFPHADVRFRSTGPAGDGPISLSHTSPLLKEMVVNRRGLRDWTRSFDLICDIRGGDSFTDIYSMKGLFKMTTFPLYARALSVPLVMLPQTIGPFERQPSQLLARRQLRACLAVMARDPVSATAAANLGRPVDATATDVVFGIPRPRNVEPGEQDVVLNVSGLLWSSNRHVDADIYRTATRALIDALLNQGRRVCLLAHVVGPDETGPDNDRTALAELRGEYQDRLQYVVPKDLWEVRRVIASARVVIGARMHACLNALSVGVPAVPLAYSRKFAPLLDSLGWQHTVALDGSAEDTVAAVLRKVDILTPGDVTPVLEEANRRIDTVVDVLRELPLDRP